MKSGRAIRRDRIMSMKASGPSLVPGVRQTSYLDYQSMSAADKNKYEKMINEFKTSGTIACPTDRAYFKLMIILREQRRVLASQGRIEDCTELDTLTRQLSDFFVENKMYVSKAESVAIIQAQYDAEKARLEELEESWKQRYESLLQQRAQEEANLEQQAQKTINNYDNSIPAELPTEFTRLSADLLDLKDRERHLISQRRFDEAAVFHKEFLRRQKAELVKRKEEYANHFEQNRTEIERRLAKKATGVKSDWDRKVEHFVHTMNAELVPLRDGVANIFKRLVDAKSEYVGEDDPILQNDPSLAGTKTTGNQFCVTAPVTARGGTSNPPTITSTRRSIERQKVLMSTRRMADAMKRQNNTLDSKRWPR